MTILERDHRAVSHIVDELISYAIREKAQNISFSISVNNDEISVVLEDDGTSELSENALKRLIRILNQPRRDDIEEYYGQLLGHGTSDSGLCLIGMMTDKVEIERKDNSTVIKLWRKYHA